MQALLFRACRRSPVGHLNHGGQGRTWRRLRSSVPERHLSADEQARNQVRQRWRRRLEAVSAPSPEPWVRADSLLETLALHRCGNDRKAALQLRHGKNRPTRHWTGRVTNNHTSDSSTRRGRPHHLPIRASSPSAQEESGNYEGVVVPVLSEWHARPSLPALLRLPWIRKANRISDGRRAGMSAVQRLGAELQSVDAYLRPSAEEEIAANVVMEQIQVALGLRSVAGTCGVKLTGSRATGLHGPFSDVDFSLTVAADEGPRLRPRALDLLRHLWSHLSRRSRTDGIRLTRFSTTAQHPIIEGVHEVSGVPFQIQVSPAYKPADEMVKSLRAEFPTLEILFRTLRHMLEMRGLNDGFQGGLTSYPLAIMIATSLKLGPPVAGVDEIGQQFLDFVDLFGHMDFYSAAIDYRSEASRDEGQVETSLPKAAADGHAGPYDPFSAQPFLVTKPKKAAPNQFLMTLQDPADTANDLGARCTNIKHVQAVFRAASQQVHRAMGEWDSAAEDGDETTRRTEEQSLLRWCLEGNYTVFELSRRALRSVGTAQS